MTIDWMLVATIAAPVLALFVGAAINRLLERRVRLISFIAHASGVQTSLPNGNAVTVHTHTVVVRNAGKLPAHNVRIGHATLPPAFSINPPIQHSVNPIVGSGSEILIPILVAGEQITIAYLYFPPLTWEGVNRYVKSDEGFANIIKILVTPRRPRWQRNVNGALVLTGAITLLYLTVQVLVAVGRHVAGP
jgi:hypothetical protein